ncbi:MAG TPA: copper resistance protein, partial [Alphaproteobacteria bacterium]|nr:copper resistance protein [Alphaproteobacteria bacterium]
MGEARLLWPAPHRFSVLGLNTMGYTDEVVLPVVVAPLEIGKPIRLAGRVRYLTCEEICVPYEANLALDLPAGPETSSLQTGLIERFLQRVPGAGETTGFQIMRVTVEGSPPAQALRLSVIADAPLTAPDVFIEGPRGVVFGAPEVRLGVDRRSALMRISVSTPKGEPIDLAGKSIGLTLVDGGRALERSVTATAEVSRGLIAVLALALLGGLVLNLMPCVLPVLSIKLLSVVGHGGADPRPVRIGFLASAGGILTSFLVLATGTVALKSAGIAAAWGIQFQQPLFLAVMVVVLTLFACNLWGLFEFRLPGSLANAADRAGGGTGIGGQFLTGAFATVLATPCSAPFLGTVIGFALARGAAEIYLVFIALGIGLALPYLVIAAAPKLATRLPRPGRWMTTLRRVLSLALAATAVWLLTVLSVQTGYAGAGLIALLMVAVAFALRQARHLTGRAHLASWLVAGAMSALALGAASSLANQESEQRAALDAETWQTFKLATIADEIANGRVVFVDVTADWCLTCKVNKLLVLDRGEV